MALHLSILTSALGAPGVHSIETKVDQAAAFGYEAIEVFYEDLEYLARNLPGGLTDENRQAAARQIRAQCDRLNLDILTLQPFVFYEGLTDRDEHASRIAKLKLWFLLLRELRCDMIQMPTQFQRDGVSGDEALVLADLTELADLCLVQSPPIRVAYEAMAFGTFIDTWEGAWEMIKKVNRPNFGCVLDTFHIAGRIWADPTAVSGKTPDAEKALKESLARLVKEIDLRKLFYVQIGGAERMDKPLTETHPWWTDGQLPRMVWCRAARLFPCDERGDYLPTIEIVKAIVKDLGFRGWLSLEVFSRHNMDPDLSVPRENARRGAEGVKRVIEQLQLEYTR